MKIGKSRCSGLEEILNGFFLDVKMITNEAHVAVGRASENRALFNEERGINHALRLNTAK